MRKITATVVILFTILGTYSLAYAHELLPKELKEYIYANPNATPDEIKAFVEKQNPQFASKFESGEELLNAALNQDTTTLDTVFDFFRIGVEHILIGTDHVLFVFAILLVFTSFKAILKNTAVFTIAHSTTLLLAGSGLLVLGSNVVEPLIALSIAYLAITTVFFRERKFMGDPNGKTGAIFFFGLFHGLGFAGILNDLSIPYETFISSLIAFNLGVEVGQLIVVAITLPFIYLFRNKKWYGKVIKVIAIAISIIAILWFIERVFFT